MVILRWNQYNFATLLICLTTIPTLDIIILRIHSAMVMRAGLVLARHSYACADASCLVLLLIIHARVIMLCAHDQICCEIDRERICHLRTASVAALRAGAETDTESPALDSAHGSQQLSALALSTGSQCWLSAHGLSAWLQCVSFSAGFVLSLLG